MPKGNRLSPLTTILESLELEHRPIASSVLGLEFIVGHGCEEG
jgi:hypothetical protein